MTRLFLSGYVGEDITLDVLQNVTNETQIVLNTDGGGLIAGLAIYDHLKSINIETITVNGMCASSGIQILASAKKRIGLPNSRYLVHNPHTLAGGDAEQIRKTADALQAEQDSLVNFYVQNFGNTAEFWAELMKKEVILTPKEALSYNIITEIQNFENFFNMENEQKTALEKLGEQFAELKNLFISGKKTNTVTNMIVTTVTGQDLNFPTITEESQIAVGVECTAADGEYMLPNGKTITVTGGKVESIVDTAEMVDAMKKKEDEMKAENTELQNKLTQLQNKFSAIENKFNELKNISSKEQKFDSKQTGTGNEKTEKFKNFTLGK